MRFRQSLAAVFAALFLSAAVAPAMAQPYGYGYGRPRGGSLTGTTLLHVVNQSSSPIVSFIAVAHHQGFFSNWSSVHNMLPGGSVFPGQSVVVNFPSCFDDIHIVTAKGVAHDSFNVPVCHITNYVVRGW